MIRKIFQWTGSLLIGGLLLFLLAVMGYPQSKGKWGEALPLSTPLPTPSLWENATIDQIHFGEPRVVLTDTLGLRIVGWISNEEVLLLRDTKPGRRGSAIEVFNVKTGVVKRLAEGRFSGRPVWNSVWQAVVYLQYDEGRRQRDLMWQSLDSKEGQRLASNVVLPIVLTDGGKGAMAYSVERKALMGRPVTLGAQERQLSFGQYAMRIPTPYEWIYQTAVSPGGEWQAVYNCEHFLLVNTEEGQIKELDLGTERPGRGLPRWATEAQWSPDGKRLAVIATVGRLPNTIRFLLLVDPWKDEIQTVSLPYGFPTGLAWAPNGRFLLVEGVVGTIPPGFELHGARLIDTETMEQREVKIFPERSLGGEITWSPGGGWTAFLCRPFEQGRLGHIAVCLSSVEVR